MPQPLAHNGVVGGSSPPEPTTQSFEPEDFTETAEKLAELAGFCGCVSR